MCDIKGNSCWGFFFFLPLNKCLLCQLSFYYKASDLVVKLGLKHSISLHCVNVL